MNVSTEVLVKTTLLDKVLWHQRFVEEEERKNRSKAPLPVNTLATRMKKSYGEVRILRDRV